MQTQYPTATLTFLLDNTITTFHPETNDGTVREVSKDEEELKAIVMSHSASLVRVMLYPKYKVIQSGNKIQFTIKVGNYFDFDLLEFSEYSSASSSSETSGPDSELFYALHYDPIDFFRAIDFLNDSDGAYLDNDLIIPEITSTSIIINDITFQVEDTHCYFEDTNGFLTLEDETNKVSLDLYYKPS